MSLSVWILLGLAVWVALGTVVALLVGRMVRRRDAQVPHDAAGEATGSLPEPRDGTDRPSLEGSGRRRPGTPPLD
ncbi:MAG: hypothetical protein M3235_21565 [Actinomycetota bacterium]|nr:hypothetical protein [Actinomycetota bacterium]